MIKSSFFEIKNYTKDFNKEIFVDFNKVKKNARQQVLIHYLYQIDKTLKKPPRKDLTVLVITINSTILEKFVI